jgi:hypothetical protein
MSFALLALRRIKQWKSPCIPMRALFLGFAQIDNRRSDFRRADVYASRKKGNV